MAWTLQDHDVVQEYLYRRYLLRQQPSEIEAWLLTYGIPYPTTANDGVSTVPPGLRLPEGF